LLHQRKEHELKGVRNKVSTEVTGSAVQELIKNAKILNATRHLRSSRRVSFILWCSGMWCAMKTMLSSLTWWQQEPPKR